MNEKFTSIKNRLQPNEVEDSFHEKNAKKKVVKERNESSKVVRLNEIGLIRTPYETDAPYQPVEEDEGNFKIILNPEYKEGLHLLEKFTYIYVIYYIHQLPKGKEPNIITPPWTNGHAVGIFASRSPMRPNPIGISVVRIKKIIDNAILTSGLDVFDGTPLIDIKPYIKDLDSKEQANYGWIEDLEGFEHLMLHIKGIPHDY